MKPGPRAAIAAVVAAAFALAGAGPALAEETGRPAPTPEERAAALARPAVVYLEQHWQAYVFDENGKPFNGGGAYQLKTRCTGFGISPNGYVATAGHCVDPGMEGVGRSFLLAAVGESIRRGYYNTDDPARLLAFGEANWRIEGQTRDSPADREVYLQRGVAAGGRTTGEVLPARVVDFRKLSEGDVALLKVETSDLPAVELATGTDVEIGTRVLSIGYPGSTDQVTDASFEPTNKDGQISAKKSSGGVPVYETSAALSGGMSGGPTVDLQGRVVGVNSFKVNGEEQAFNFLAPAGNLSELLTRNGVTPELGPNDQTFRKGLDDYFAGRYTAAIASFDKVLSLAPTHEQAQEYKTKAAKAREQYGDAADAAGIGALVLLVVAGGVLLAGAVLAVVLVLVLRGRRNRSGAGVPGGPVPGHPGGYGPGGPGGFAPAHPAGYAPGQPSQPAGPFSGQPTEVFHQAPAMPVNPYGYQPTAPTLDTPPEDSTGVGSPAPGAGFEPSPAFTVPGAPPGAVTMPTPSPGAVPAPAPAPPAHAEVAPTGPRFCPGCGAQAAPGTRFCPGCGAAVG
ncbi:MAG TPA: trypsin-like peptidase domain-containing protein [Pilimelia sp.]|nr:trypsin-like peptidase domain-containing protein [Pilimelia sp.]